MESATQSNDAEDDRVLALLQGLSDKLGAVEQEILTDANGKTTRRVKDKLLPSKKGEARNLQDEVHSLRRRRPETVRKGSRSMLRFCIQFGIILLLLLGGYLYLRRQTRPFDIGKWREGNGLHWFDRSSFEEGGLGTGTRNSETRGATKKAEGALVGLIDGGQETGAEIATDGAVKVGQAETEGAGMDEQQSQLRKKVSDAKTLLSDEVGAAKSDALHGAELGNAIKEKVLQLEQEEAEETEGDVTGKLKVGEETAGARAGDVRRSGR